MILYIVLYNGIVKGAFEDRAEANAACLTAVENGLTEGGAVTAEVVSVQARFKKKKASDEKFTSLV